LSVVQVAVTATATLLAVFIGGGLTVFGQDRLWRRDHARQWRDIRLARYIDFLTAFREYVAYVLQPSARVTALPRQRSPHDLMPFFDEAGTRYKEKLESAKTAVRLVSRTPELVAACSALTRAARLLAADRATHTVDAMPAARFDALWAAERRFVDLARLELGLREGVEPGEPGPATAPD
jgi:hypothetical protein